MRTRIAIIAALVALAGQAQSAQEVYGLGSAAAPWLKIPSSARVLAMGESGAGLADGMDAAELNPAGLGAVKGHQVALMHNAWLGSTAVEHLAYGMGLGEGMGLGLTFSYLGFGTIEKYGYDISGNLVSTGSVSPYGYVGGLVFGHKIENLSYGLAAKYVGQTLVTSSSSTFSADLGGKLGLMGGLALGAAVKDLGGQLAGSNLASALKLGVSWSNAEMAGVGNEVNLALDLNGPLAEFSATAVNVGGEFWIQGMAALRAGYRVARAGAGGLSGLSAGLGFKYQAAELNYAFTSFGELGAANQVSLLARFGQDAAPKNKLSKDATSGEEPGFRMLNDGKRSTSSGKSAKKSPGKR